MSTVLAAGARKQPILEAIRDALTDPGSWASTYNLTWLGLVLVLIALIVLAVRWSRWVQQLPPRRNAQRLFLEALEVLELPESERRLLRRVAFELRLKQPILMLMSPGLFDQTCAKWLGQADERVRRPAAALLRRTRRRLFDEEPASPGSGPKAEPTRSVREAGAGASATEHPTDQQAAVGAARTGGAAPGQVDARSS